MPPPPAPLWIRCGRAYRGWAWVLALAGLWLGFALLLLAIAQVQREQDGGALGRAALGYGLTAVAAVLVALCAFIRRPWAQQLVSVSAAPMLLFFPLGTVVAACALRALLRNRAWFEGPRTYPGASQFLP